ncbi:agmatine deiminase family protein [Leptothoe spongobia]|uniref:Agmatine deiminase family protein n=1 Tax=Leptothoe spongobia TAU-MAC 1115 TaxID=1967444 RepID=A0A947GKH7_9CYAN|nr:agmatine deiminase family protein [Leptothoe spongobia]MBT9317439.1 agmatine deiminase family protein [Leptothoe spongobia TAU-MAC 1115]
MVTRRQLLQNTALFTGGLLMGCTNSNTHTASPWRMPDEAMPHERTWMAFGASERIWGRRLLPEVRRNLVTIAHTIAQYEPVSMLVRAEDHDLAHNLLGAAVELIVSPLDDLWIRDTGPLFVLSEQGTKAGINFNFNGWGRKQVFQQDAAIAEFVTQQASAEVINTSLVLEGGCIEVDGQGTAIITESCVLNDNRNPGITKAQFEDLLMPLLGLEKIIWLPGIKGYDITDGHTDFYARFAKPGLVLAGYEPNPEYFDHGVTQQHLEILEGATDAQGQPLEVIVLAAPSTIRDTYETEDFAAGYIGFYACNHAIIMQEFGDDQADQMAQAALQQAFPEREIIAINIDGIAAGGGSIHCATQQEPNLVG